MYDQSKQNILVLKSSFLSFSIQNYFFQSQEKENFEKNPNFHQQWFILVRPLFVDHEGLMRQGPEDILRKTMFLDKKIVGYFLDKRFRSEITFLNYNISFLILIIF